MPDSSGSMFDVLVEKLDALIAASESSSLNQQSVARELEQLIEGLQEILAGLGLLGQVQQDLNLRVGQVESSLATALAKLGQIILALAPPSPAAAIMNISIGGINMAGKTFKATLDLQLPDQGSGTATLTFVDAAGLPATIPPTSTATTTWSSSNPAIVVTPNATNPLMAAFAPSVPPVLATAVVLTAAVSITDPTLPAISLTATGQPIDVVSGGPAGVQMTETEP
jgi:hypothetical protein